MGGGDGGDGGDGSDDHLRSQLQDEAFSFSSSSSSSSEYVGDPDDLRRCQTYAAVLQSYGDVGGARAHRSLQEAKDMIRKHNPGDWIEEVGGVKASDYDVPEATTLLLVGPRGSGKSALINRVTKVFDDDPYTHDRAQVSHNLSSTRGTCFLQEYMIPRKSKSLCIYDSRSLSTVESDNFNLLQSWMTHGVRHGEMVIRDSDDLETRKSIKAMARHGRFGHCQKRMVNLVIFVVDGTSVLKSMTGDDTQYTDLLIQTFNYPFLSFKDNKPIVVVTHGNELTFLERARVRTHLGELLGIPPIQQIFDIPVTSDYETDLVIVDMLRCAIDRAARNVACKQNYALEGQRIFHFMLEKLQEFDLILQAIIIGLCIIILLLHFVISA